MWYIYMSIYLSLSLYINGILFSHKREGNAAICDNMGGPWEHYAKWNKPDKKDKYCMISLTYGI